MGTDTRLRGLRWWTELGWRHVVGVVTIVVCVFPLLYALSASVNPAGTLTGSHELFRVLSAENYLELGSTPFLLWMRNSLLVSSLTAVGTVLMGAAAAYAFSRFRFTRRRAGLTTLLLLQMFPQMLAFVAIFLVLLAITEVYPFLGLNSHLGLVCVYLGGALGVNTFLMYGYFNTIPRELDEAARIDGATHAQIFFRIIMRLVAPILTVVGLLSFIGTYSDFVIARVVLQRSEQFTLAIGLYNWGSDERNAPWGEFAAGAVLAAIPVVVLFLFLQRYVVSGLTAGATKG
ncbi:sugar ABC transporter permease [Homoserinibacter sp. YIM 151385]|uniref:sugar ABC transporter permease n=1 Tax=Homoserinibacter sp. YIM 151385 TaxID=2985506 RepID=UPI0022F032AA|nr:sugar ABC transporter permease [Homoserinibacter sp. YIM 151385]WBU37507.1 sugar ABC transporter permease [Homoserinibacter sp. YIM 151385]